MIYLVHTLSLETLEKLFMHDRLTLHPDDANDILDMFWARYSRITGKIYN